MEEEICTTCGKKADWIYMPASAHENPYLCDTCVPRGCVVCNNYNFEDFPEILQEAVEKEWKFKIDGDYLVTLDEQGREYPCCEYWELNDS